MPVLDPVHGFCLAVFFYLQAVLLINFPVCDEGFAACMSRLGVVLKAIP